MQTEVIKGFVQACAEGNEAQFYAILSDCLDAEREILIKFDRYACFHQAIANGHIVIANKILEYMLYAVDQKQQSPDFKDDWYCSDDVVLDVFMARGWESLKVVLHQRHIVILQWLLQNGYLRYEVLRMINANDEFIKIVIDAGLIDIISELFADACRINIHAVNRLLKIIPKNFYMALLVFNNFASFQNAVRYNHMDMLELLWHLSEPAIKCKVIVEAIPECLIEAIKSKRILILRQILAWLNPDQQCHCLSYNEFNSFVYAADRGNIDIIKLIYTILPPVARIKAISASNFAAYRLAKRGKHFDILAFLEKIASDNLIIKMKKASTQSVCKALKKTYLNYNEPQKLDP